MQYFDFQGKKISKLGFGAMRMPTLDKEGTVLDEARVDEMVDKAIAGGINYFDTAWGYHGGNSEITMGKTLKRFPRESFYLASKFPGYDVSNMDKVEEIFNKQLEKCQVDYFDFYLFHNVCEDNIDLYLDNEKYGIYDFLIKARNEGKIKHLGFSVHGNYDTMMRFINAYGDDIEFCQVQLNYVDWDYQDAKLKVEELRKRNIPVWVMEPIRGGSLATMASYYKDKLDSISTCDSKSAVEWAFDYVKSIDGVGVVLSGMSNLEQIEENLRIFDKEEILSENEINALYSIGAHMTSSTSVMCTACRYCTENCPQGIDIPKLIELYNECTYLNASDAECKMDISKANSSPADCISCAACEALCPQKIEIASLMAKMTDMI